MPQPLKGYRVADFSHVMAGPFCSHFLRMLGAEVVKIESLRGDAMRDYGPFRECDGLSPAFIAANAGKSSLAVDLKSPEGIEIARRLVGRCNVVLENFRPGVMDRLGIGYAACKLLNPQIVYCAVSGYGQSGAWRDLPAIDNIVQATGGVMAANGEPEDPPSRAGWPVIDTYTGTLAALAVLGALLQRERFGEGQYIDVAMLDASVVLLTALATPYLVTGKTLPRTGDVGYSGSPTSATFLAQDGTRLALGVVQNNHFALLCGVLARPELADDVRFREPVSRTEPENAALLRGILSDIFITRPGGEWEHKLSAVGVPCGLIRGIDEVCEKARTDSRGLIVPTLAVADGAARPAGYVNAGFVFEHDGPGCDGLPPMLGEHTEAVLSSLGYGERAIASLIERRIVLAGMRHPGREDRP
ncbi:MAG TPA: CoA transferase [Steroidobacteraceae bacterium]|jgi:crotonobetainyl-CoA:carnitine CoA-transferase CaiB-like acyl-CoA transferase